VGSKLIARLQKKKLKLTEYENRVSGDVIDPSELEIGWSEIGGLEKVIDILKESIVLPLTRPDLFGGGSKLLRAPRGLLLHGPPGCGKTLLIKALAKETDCCFISLQPSTFMDKWFGESQKLVEAVFSLAEKLSPCILFIDEIDAFLRERSKQDNESSAHIKAQFMTLWDGFSSTGAGSIVIVGATNRPNDVDAAILRRMPIRCRVGLPNAVQRKAILAAILQNEVVANDFDMEAVAESTQGFSGNDLTELCRATAMRAVRHFINLEAPIREEGSDAPIPKAELTNAHFAAARDEWIMTNPALTEIIAQYERTHDDEQDTPPNVEEFD
jgi:SpoVK/Ycf46/Vps4 family AAA+-type ATPase